MPTLKSHLDGRREQERGWAANQPADQAEGAASRRPLHSHRVMAPGREGGASGQGLPRSSRMERPGDPHQTRGRQEQKASRRKEKGGQGSSERPTPPLRVRTGRQALRRSGAGTRGVRAAPARGGCRQRAEHRPGPPPGKPGAEKPCGSGARGGQLPCPAPQGAVTKVRASGRAGGPAPPRGRSPRSWGGCTSHSGQCPAGS